MTLQRYLDRGLPPLPIDNSMGEIVAALEIQNAAVIIAPPGAGKTSRVPMALLDQLWMKGKKIIMLEPRRLAARSAANHMASLMGEKAGQTIGYRIRMDTKVSTQTRVEIVTDGVFVRMIMEDPELTGIGAVIFDEFHERSLDSDFGLALSLETQEALRPDLRLLPMSATIDGAIVAGLFDAGGKISVVKSMGRSFPVTFKYQPKNPNERIEDSMASAIRSALKEYDGSLLCFLPGQAEIQRTAERLIDLPDTVDVFQLYGALDQASQSRAIKAPESGKRKIVLATSIAETSITIDGVRVVIDSGLARVARYEPATGLTRLVTQKASKASIDQRAGRAGRTAPGTALRLWHEGQTASLPDYERPQILEADIAGLVLDLAQWGVSDPSQLKWIDMPPKQAWKEAVDLLRSLGALNEKAQITPIGKTLRNLPLPPRLAYLISKGVEHNAAKDAAFLSVLLQERGLGGNEVDLAARFEKAKVEKSVRAEKLRNLASGFLRNFSVSNNQNVVSIGALLSFAWPERIAAQIGFSDNGEVLYKLANGRRARLDGLSQLAKEKHIVVSDLQGSAGSARILAGAAISLDEIQRYHGHNIQNTRTVDFDPKSQKLKARNVQLLGQLELASTIVGLQPDDNPAARLLEQLKMDGIGKLAFSKAVTSFQQRAIFLHNILPSEFPDFSDKALEESFEEWLLPFIPNASGYNDITSEILINGFSLRMGHSNIERFAQLAPSSFTLPSGMTHGLFYEGQKVVLRAKVQEFFGMKSHPAISNGKISLTLEFLSPAMRPIQTTEDIVGFWAGSWADVRRDLRGRYPKHLWPEDPANAAPTARAKPRAIKE